MKAGKHHYVVPFVVIGILASYGTLMAQIGNPGVSDTLSTNRLTLDRIDSLVNLRDSLGEFRQALQLSKTGLVLAKREDDPKQILKYHLRLAKFHFNTGNVDQALIHFRLFSLAKEEEIKNASQSQMLELEEAYLDEIDNLVREAQLNQTLIDNLTEENEAYYSNQRIISTSAKIAIVIILLMLSLYLYNRHARKKGAERKVLTENEEIERLKSQLDKVEGELARNDKEISHLKKRTTQSIHYAKSIQTSLLPVDGVRQKIIKNSFLISLPKDSVSGDFYFVSTVSSKKVVGIFDCPGHGVDAAHSTLLGLTIFKDILAQGITAPSMILTMMDQRLKQEIKKLEEREERISGTKVAICTITPKTKEVEFAGAHFPLFYSHLDDLHFVKGNRFPIGDPTFSDRYYSSKKIRLSSGDMIYFSTDGFYNQLGGKKVKRFLRSSMVHLLTSILSQPLTEQKYVLEKVFKEWKGKRPQTDDVLMLGIRL